MHQKRLQQLTERFRCRNESPIAEKFWKKYQPKSYWELPDEAVLRREYPDLEQVQVALKRELKPGATLMVGVGRSGDAAVFEIVRGRCDVSSPTYTHASLQIHPHTMNAWYDARAAVPRSLTHFLSPSRWASIESFPELKILGGITGPHDSGLPAIAVDGASFGLAFALSIASHVLGLHLQANSVGLATCDAQGALGPIEALKEKILILKKVAPRIDEVWLSEDQMEEAQQLPQSVLGGITCVGIPDLRYALARQFPRSADSDLGNKMRALVDEQNADTVANELLEYILLDQHQRPNLYEPIYATAEQICRRSPETLREEVRLKLNFIRAVCRRHDGEEAFAEECMPNTIEWANEYPRWLYLHVLAEYCQHLYDTGQEAREQIYETLHQKVSDLDIRDASFEELRFLGAWTRYRELGGVFHGALRKQTTLATEWLKRRQYAESTRPLSRALALAGALQDDKAMQELGLLVEQTLTYLPMKSQGRGHIRLAQFRAAVCLGETRFANRFLARLKQDSPDRLPSYMRLTMARFELRACEDQTEPRYIEAREALGSAHGADSEYPLILQLEDALTGPLDEHMVRFRMERLCDDSKQFDRLCSAVRRSRNFGGELSDERIARLALDLYPY